MKSISYKANGNEHRFKSAREVLTWRNHVTSQSIVLNKKYSHICSDIVRSLHEVHKMNAYSGGRARFYARFISKLTERISTKFSTGGLQRKCRVNLILARLSPI
jgi:hypothetical protein